MASRFDNPDALSTAAGGTKGVWIPLGRWILGALFLYMGLNKALEPVEFLKLVREYGIMNAPWGLNLVAAVLPWLEAFSGLLLLLGVAVRGTALLVAGMLVPFTLVVLHRALAIHEAGTLAFCAIKFDCGCGTGEVFICRKLAENTFLALLAFTLAFVRQHRFCLWKNR